MYNDRSGQVLVAGLAVFGVWLAVVVGIICVVVHFIAKFW